MVVASSSENGSPLSKFSTPSTSPPLTIGTASSARVPTAPGGRMKRGSDATSLTSCVWRVRAAAPINNARTDWEVVLAPYHGAIRAAESPEHHRRRVGGVDQRNGDIRVHQQFVDGVRRALQQLIQRQIRRKGAPDARDQGTLLAAALLALITTGVLDRNRGVAGEKFHGGDILVVEAARR